MVVSDQEAANYGDIFINYCLCIPKILFIISSYYKNEEKEN